MPDKKAAETKTVNVSDKDVNDNKVWAIISYLWILSLVSYFGKKDSPFAQYHAKQGLVLLAFSLLPLALSIIFGILAFIPGVNIIVGLISVILIPIYFVYGLCMLVLVILGIINAANGKIAELPVIGKLSKYITF